MRTAILAPFLLISAVAQDAPPPLDVGTLELSGTGCPAGTYDIDIMAAGGFIFHAFNATIDGSAACRAQIGVELTAGYRVALSEVAVTGGAGLDVGVVARVNTTASWEEGTSIEEQQVLYGSAVGVDFPNPFVANPIYEDHKSACGPGSVLLSIDVEVELEREEGEGEGVVTVEFAGLRISSEACGGEDGEGTEEPSEEEPVEEEPVEEEPVEEEPVEEEPVEEEPVEEEAPEGKIPDEIGDNFDYY